MGRASTDKRAITEIPENPLKNIPVEDLYEGDKYDFSQMEEQDIFNLLEYVLTTSPRRTRFSFSI